MAAAVGFWWHRDSAGYDIKTCASPPSHSIHEDSSKCIVARGGEAELYWLDGTSNRVFEDLVNTSCDPQGALVFTNRWGFLCRHHLRDKEMKLAELNGFYDQVHHFNNMLTLVHLKNYKDLIRNIHRADTSAGEISGTGHFTLDVMMRPGVESPQVFIRPDSLLSFAAIELMQTIAGAAEIRTCPHCRNFFTVSSDANRRLSRRYCSDRCKVATSRKRTKEDAAKEAKKASAAALAAAPSPTPEPLPRPALPPRRRRKPEDRLGGN